MTEPEPSIAFYMNRVRGRLCGLIESFGLDPRQERACIQTLKSLTYDLQAQLEDQVDELNQ